MFPVIKFNSVLNVPLFIRLKLGKIKKYSSNPIRNIKVKFLVRIEIKFNNERSKIIFINVINKFFEIIKINVDSIFR
jgi:hypothetical protein